MACNAVSFVSWLASRYLRYASLFQNPRPCMISPGSPDEKAQVAPPLLKEWPEICRTSLSFSKSRTMDRKVALERALPVAVQNKGCSGWALSRKLSSVSRATAGHNADPFKRGRTICKVLSLNCKVLVTRRSNTYPPSVRCRSAMRRSLLGLKVDTHTKFPGRSRPKKAVRQAAHTLACVASDRSKLDLMTFSS